MPDSARIAAVILAAGSSRRMGRAKALLPLDGKPILAHAIESLLTISPAEKIVVVTGHEPQALEPIIDAYRVRRAHNAAYDAGGMLSSVKAGLAQVADADAVFIALVDHPRVRPGTLRNIASAFRARRPRVVVPSYDGKGGHPILLCGCAVAEVLELPADATLKTYTTIYRDYTLTLDVDDPAVLQDLDTPADYAAAVREFEAGQTDCLDTRSNECQNPQQPTAAATVPLGA